MRSKRKGNNFENKIAKELGLWMFNDQHMLGRDITSGGKKVAWIGDIIPQKQLPPECNDLFPFYIECKNGYGNKIPTFFNYDIIKKWLDKCEKDKNEQQNIIFLIVQFKNMKTILLVSNKEFFIGAETWFLSFKHNDKIYYIYDYKRLISNNFDLEVFKYEHKTVNN